jgi:hypothetical protein
LAYANIYLITLADYPIYLSTIAEATTLMNFASTLQANALAIKVLPVPGGPYIKHPEYHYFVPLGGFIPTLLNN